MKCAKRQDGPEAELLELHPSGTTREETNGQWSAFPPIPGGQLRVRVVELTPIRIDDLTGLAY